MSCQLCRKVRWDLIELLNLRGHFCLQSTTVATNYLSVGPGSTHLPGPRLAAGAAANLQLCKIINKCGLCFIHQGKWAGWFSDQLQIIILRFQMCFFGKLAYIGHIYNLLFYLPLLNKYFCGDPSIPPSNIKWETCWEVRRAWLSN